ncbi:MAG: hypothetical protein H6Q59_1792, partial [Firmicutes bacterium]|nr:hypothetical protein [Bacillota bacterium]
MGKVKIMKKIIAVALSVAMFAVSFNVNIDTQGVNFQQNSTAYAAGLGTRTPEMIQEGTILQAFCWSFDTITANMEDIAEAGYTAIQTSPIQACLDTNPAMTLGNTGHWYYHYQPTDFTIGNYQLGDEADFVAMCTAAENAGIKVIVDMVPNHTTTALDQVSPNLVSAASGSSIYHDTGLTSTSNYSDRSYSTRYAVGNLPDIDTENPGFQNYFINFINQCIADGADGFRYDSAKHIGLPGDPGVDESNSFWNKVTTQITNAENIFNYGEVLQGTGDRLADYVNAIGATTSSAYGAQIRSALVGNSYKVSDISGYAVEPSVDPNNLVTWVESHDNYYNDGSWSQLDNTQIALGWAIITARAKGTPLFFSRPQGSSTTNQYGTNTIGIAGDDNYKNDQVVAVNKFRAAMAGQPENLINPNGNAQVLMIERGTEGLVIVNGSSSDYALDSDTNLADGTYINHTNNHNVFTVVGGKISGVLPARSAVVLYGAEATNSTTVHFYNADKWSSVYALVGSEDIPATSDGDG